MRNPIKVAKLSINDKISNGGIFVKMISRQLTGKRLILQLGWKRSYASVKTPNVDWDPIRTNRQLIKGRELTGKTSRKILFGLLCLAPVITFALGCWQVKRLRWKNKLVAECEDRLTYKPIPLPKYVTQDDVQDLEYRKVLVTGEFDYLREVFVGPRLHDERKGYLVLCPFVQSNGAGEVIIDRGWIAADKIVQTERNLQHLSCPKGVITIECVVRVAPTKGIFHFDHEKGSRLYQYIDINAMAEELNSRPIYLQALQNFHDRPEWMNGEKLTDKNSDKKDKSAGWLFWGSPESKLPEQKHLDVVQGPDKTFDTAEEFDPSQFVNAGVPLGKIPKIDYKNNHLNYLVTWFSLSFASAILLVYILRKGRFISPTEEKLKHAKKILE